MEETPSTEGAARGGTRAPGGLRGFLLLLVVALPAPVPAAMQAEAAGSPQKEQEGESVPVVGITVSGNRRYLDSQIVKNFAHPLGIPLDERRVERGIRRLYEIFRVRVDVKKRRVVDADGRAGLELLLEVQELSYDLEPRFIGNVDVDTEELLEWAHLDEDRELYLFQAPRVRERLLAAYKREGYYFAEVRVVEREERTDPETGAEQAADVIFEIKEGPQVHVRDVVLHGNDSFGNWDFLFLRGGLGKLSGMQLRDPILFSLFAKKFDPEVLDADVIGIREVYRDLGYLDAVVQVERLEFEDDRSWVTVHVRIDEGRRYEVGTVTIETYVFEPNGQGGLEPVEADPVYPEDELLGLLKLQPGVTFERRFVAEDRTSLRNKFAEKGYIDHQSVPAQDRWQFRDAELVFHEAESKVDVTYIILQGRQQFIREILVRGNLYTQDRVIRRLLTVEPGDVANPQEIARSRARVERTGFFSNTFNLVDHREPTFRFLETGDPNWKDLEYTVEEGDDLQFNISGGVSSNDGAFGIVSVTRRNFDIFDVPKSPWALIEDVVERRAFHGAGQELSIEASPGTEISFFRVRFNEPDLFYTHQDRVSLTLNAQNRLRRFETHDEERSRFGARFGRQIGPDSTVFVGYEFGQVDIDDIDTGGEPSLSDPLAVPKLLKDQEGESYLGFVEFGYSYNDLDSSFNPRQGKRFVWSNGVYDEVLGSDYDFVRSDVRFDFYDVFDDSNPAASSRYRLGLVAAVSVPYGQTDDVPYSERDFLGGRSTMRGFDYRGVGPNDDGIPLGGETMLYGTLELRRPLVTTTQPGTYREIETVQGGVFLDVGVLDPDAFDIDLDEVRISAGFLFGITAPLPITFSFGFPIREGEGDDTQVVGFSIGF